MLDGCIVKHEDAAGLSPVWRNWRSSTDIDAILEKN